VKKRYRLTQPLLIFIKAQLAGQIQHLFAGAATVLFFEFQIGIDDFIIAIKARYIIIEPELELV